jgi:hypothetical protein
MLYNLVTIKNNKRREKKITAKTVHVKSFANFVFGQKNYKRLLPFSSSVNLLNSSLVFLD